MKLSSKGDKLELSLKYIVCSIVIYYQITFLKLNYAVYRNTAELIERIRIVVSYKHLTYLC